MALKDLAVKAKKSLSKDDFEGIPQDSTFPATLSSFNYYNGFAFGTLEIGDEGTIRAILGSADQFPIDAALKLKGKTVVATYRGTAPEGYVRMNVSF